MGIPIASGPGAANTPVVLTVPGRKGYGLKVTQITTTYSAAPTAGRVTVAESVNPGVNVQDVDIPGTGVQFIVGNNDGLEFGDNVDCIITLAPGGAAVVGKVNAAYNLEKL